MTEYMVGITNFEDRIYAGRVMKDGSMSESRSDVTVNVVNCVIELMRRNLERGADSLVCGRHMITIKEVGEDALQKDRPLRVCPCLRTSRGPTGFGGARMKLNIRKGMMVALEGTIWFEVPASWARFDDEEIEARVKANPGRYLNGANPENIVQVIRPASQDYGEEDG